MKRWCPTYPLFFIIKCHFSSYFTSHGINTKRNVSRNWVVYNCILSFISIYSMYVANLLVSFTFVNSENVWQICEFWVLVINIRHFDINSCSTGQSTSIFCFDNLLNKDHVYCWQFSCSKLQTSFLCYALLVRHCSGSFNKNPRSVSHSL